MVAKKKTMPKHIRLGLLTPHQNAPTTIPKVVAHGRGDKCIIIHAGNASDDKNQRSGNVTIAVPQQEAPEQTCGLKDGQTSPFSVRFFSKKKKKTDGDQQRSNPRVRSCHAERKRTSAGCYILWGIQQRSHPNVPTCEDVHQQRSQRC